MPIFPLIALLWLLPLSLAMAEACGQPGHWLSPSTGSTEASAQILDTMARQEVVLLGEQHDSAEDHRWQFQTLIQLQARQPKLAIGLEMVPRHLQSVLDEWLKGSLSEEALLKQLEWDKNWGHDPDLYLPIFHFARMNAVPLLALNLERPAVEAVGRNGRAALEPGLAARLPKDLGTPKAPSNDYLILLRKIFSMHKDKPQDDTHFGYFVEAQTLWDLSMAEVMGQWLEKNPEGLVVGIIGMGHVRFGHGVAHQLAGLGIQRVGGYLTWPFESDCKELVPRYADSLFVTKPLPERPPRLGIAMDGVKEGIRIASVQPGSLAQGTGLKEGDIITHLAGQPIKSTQRLRTLVLRQSPGTWLPLRLLRNGSTEELVIRFPVD